MRKRGTRDNIVAGQAEKKTEPEQEYILIPICTTDPLISQGPKDSEEDAGVKPIEVDESEALDKDRKDEQDSRSEFERLLQQEKQTEHPNSTNSINIVSTPVSTAEPSSTYDAPSLPINAAKSSKEHLIEQFSPFKNAFTLPDVPNVSPMDDNTGIVAGAYDDEDVGGQADLNNLETTTNKVWTLIDLPNGKRVIGSKWVFRNKKDKRGIVVRNKAILVAQGYTQEEGINYDEVFSPIARIEAIRLFLAYASYMGFIVYQMDVKSAFLYGTIEEEVYVFQPPGFEYPHFLVKSIRYKKLCMVYIKLLEPGMRPYLPTFWKMDLEEAPLIRYCSSRRTRTTSTPMEPNKALVKDEEVDNVDVHLYISMIGSLMCLTASRYLKGQPKLSLWYPRDSPFDLEAFSDSDYAGASLDRKFPQRSNLCSANCCGHVLWIQNQMLDYGFNFMNTKIYIDNESTICIVKNLKFHAKTKHIEIRHHFIRDSYEKRLIQVIKVSLIEQFWQTATGSTLEDGDMGIIATIDGKVKVVSKASIRRHLKLEDSDGISTLSTVEFFEQLALMRVRLYRDEGSTLQLESHHNPLGRKIAQIDEDEGITLVQMGAQTQGQINEDLITARAIPEEVSTAKADMDVTLAEALVDLLKSGKKKSQSQKQEKEKGKGSKKKAGGKRKKTLAKKRAGEKQSEESSKRKKMEDDAEKEDLRAHLDIISKDDVAVSVESLATKYPIVDWKTHVLSEDKMYYEIIRANGSTKSYKIFIEMLDDFNKHDVIHVLLMDTSIAIYMLVEKTYPLTQEMLLRMLSGKLEVDNESEMAFEFSIY
ncbi:putative ribonuclease H-like domain-containing protein [Tanacetum coccineum]